jgi:hypothetical protein
LPDGIFSYQKGATLVYIKSTWDRKCWSVELPFGIFIALLLFLLPFGILWLLLYIFPLFGLFYQENLATLQPIPKPASL